jgi:hypothetical protein
MQKVRNLNNVILAKCGFKKIKDVITCHVGVEFNFAIIVGVIIKMDVKINAKNDFIILFCCFFFFFFREIENKILTKKKMYSF